jgi:hypothetical protein
MIIQKNNIEISKRGRIMPELKEEHFEVIDKNKQKVYQEQKEMREETIDYVGSCSIFDLQEVYKIIKRLKDRK